MLLRTHMCPNVAAVRKHYSSSRVASCVFKTAEEREVGVESSASLSTPNCEQHYTLNPARQATCLVVGNAEKLAHVCEVPGQGLAKAERATITLEVAIGPSSLSHDIWTSSLNMKGSRQAGP